VDTLWNNFKTELITSIESNVPHKLITYEHRLPWVTPILRKLINKKNKAYNNRKKHPEKWKKLKNAVQK
jgi:ABC-type lipoprotein release transport system permease subunit